MIFVGIDWSTRYHDVCIIDMAGKIIKEFRIEISRGGFSKLLGILAEFEVSVIHIGIEDGNNLLVDTLVAAGYLVFALNPKRVKRFKERYAAEAKKSDRFDAYNIALILLKDGDTFAPVSRSSDLCEEMKVHCETVDAFVRARTRLMNQLWAELNLYFPAFLGCFPDMSSNVALNVLRVLSNPASLLDATREQFMGLLRDVRYMSEKRKMELYEYLSVQTVHVNTPGLAARSMRARMYADQILALNESIKALDEIVEKLYAQHPLAPVFSSLPGAGERLAPRLLALMGDDLSRFDSYHRVQCYAGTCPVTAQSGKWLHRVTMRRACNKFFRHTLHLFSFASLRMEPWAREYYDLLKARGQGHSAATRSLANKWAKIIFTMWKENRPYDRVRFLKNREIRRAA